MTGSVPIIILVRPQLGENIGMTARAMRNFGLRHLRIVAPRDGWPNPDAGPPAAGADDVLDNAGLFDTVQDAVADCHMVYATTVRRRDLPKPVFTPEQAMRDMAARTGQTCAILFGPENAGLHAQDVDFAHHILTIPTAPDFASLNLAQAVLLVAHAWSHQSGQSPPLEDRRPAPAPGKAFDLLFAQLDQALEDAGYYHVRRQTAQRQLRHMLNTTGWDDNQVRAMRGIIDTLCKKAKHRDQIPDISTIKT